MSAQQQQPQEVRRGRPRFARLGLYAVGALSVWVAGTCTAQILMVTLAPERLPTEEPCQVGTRRLLAAVERARGLSAIGSLPERQALARFRDNLSPDFRTFPSIVAKCKRTGDRSALKALRSIELLRYAEESAVRYSAVDLTRFRRRTPQLVESLSGSP